MKVKSNEFKNAIHLTHIYANEKLKSMEDFKEQCRRQLERSIDERIKYGFFKHYKPVLDDVPFRSFETMAEYRAWADTELPRYLGFKIVENNNE